jgi:hypothetical protein
VKIAGLVCSGQLNRQSTRPRAQRRTIRNAQLDLQHSHDRGLLDTKIGAFLASIP